MPLPFTLEVFDERNRSATQRSSENAEPTVGGGRPSFNADMLEKARLEGYESGYQAGWDDAARSDAEEQSRIGASFARNLVDLGFTFHEARAHVMHALEPLLTGMVDKVLPRLVSESIGQIIVEELLPLASEAADTPIEVVVCPASRPALEALLAADAAVPFTLVEEPTLADGQVFLRSAKAERHLDLTAALDQIGSAISGLYELSEKAFQNG